MYVDSILHKGYIVGGAVFSLQLQVSRGELSSSVKVEEELHQNEAKVSHPLPNEKQGCLDVLLCKQYTCYSPQVLALTKEWTGKWGETRSILQVQQ